MPAGTVVALDGSGALVGPPDRTGARVDVPGTGGAFRVRLPLRAQDPGGRELPVALAA